MIATSRRFFSVCLLLVSIIFLTVSLPGCDEAPGSGSIDGVELGLHLRLHLTDLARQTDGLDAERLSRARALFSQPPQGLDSLRIYTARTTLEDRVLDQRVALLPLQGEFAGGFLAVVVGEDGAVYRSRLWGTPAFDTDPESVWENFWRQFEYFPSKDRAHVAEATTTSRVAAYAL